MYTYEEALSKSLEYFNGDDLAAKVFLDKYALRDENDNLLELTPTDMHHRIASEFYRIEKGKYKGKEEIGPEDELNYENPLSYEHIFGLLDKFRYHVAQGSPMYGIGNDYKVMSLSNCFTSDIPYDSYSSIVNLDKQIVNISKMRGGIGFDLSNFRPKGTKTNNAAKSSTGIVSWMERYSHALREVGQSGRRAAGMMTISIHHPDILDFCTIKNDDKKVTGANISVRLTREFINAVKNDEEYELRFPVESNNVVRKIKAKEVWNTIIHSAWLRAEPGLLMWDNILENGPADQYNDYKSWTTNPCSEIPLSPLDSCRLYCLNLFSYVEHPFTDKAKFNYILFKRHAQIAQRLMDDLVDLESEKIEKILLKIEADPEPENIKRDEREMWQKIGKNNREGRRLGIGITALGDCLAALNIEYGSEQSIRKAGRIYKTLKLGCYRGSVEMAKIFGPFKCFDYAVEKNCPFLIKIQKDDANLYEDMKKYGRRNIALTTVAPTGSVSLLTQTTSGLEPLFNIEPYTRRKKITDGEAEPDFVDDLGDKWQEFKVYHPKLKMWMEITGETDYKKSPWYNCCANDINWINRVKLQSELQSHCCHALSSTLNLPNNVTEEEVSKIYLEAFSGNCKGITVYRDGCRSGVLVRDGLPKTKAPKRPKELPCDVHHITVKGQPYFVMIGIMYDQPYEVFAGKNNFIDKNVAKGKLVKVGRPKCYRAELDDDSVVQPITMCCSDDEEALTRMLSISLRHGAPIEFIVDQLDKVTGELYSFSKSVSRALKRYIENDIISTEKCKECDNKLIYQEGCKICPACGWSKC